MRPLVVEAVWAEGLGGSSEARTFPRHCLPLTTQRHVAKSPPCVRGLPSNKANAGAAHGGPGWTATLTAGPSQRLEELQTRAQDTLLTEWHTDFPSLDACPPSEQRTAGEATEPAFSSLHLAAFPSTFFPGWDRQAPRAQLPTPTWQVACGLPGSGEVYGCCWVPGTGDAPALLLLPFSPAVFPSSPVASAFYLLFLLCAHPSLCGIVNPAGGPRAGKSADTTSLPEASRTAG